MSKASLKKGDHHGSERKSGPVFAFRELEPRIAFDGALLATAFDGLSDGDLLTSDHLSVSDSLARSASAVAPVASNAASHGVEPVDLIDHDTGVDDGLAVGGLQAKGIDVSSASGEEVVFVDATVVDAATLLADLDPSYEVVLLDAHEDGLAQISGYLAGRSGISALHFIGHGDEGRLSLGASSLTLESMQGVYADTLQAIGSALSVDADILVYGCDFGAGAVGAQAALQLSMLTGADVAASDDLTGHDSLGGDWELEVATGTIESHVAIAAEAQSQWVDVLATPSDLISLPGVADASVQGAYGFEVGSDLGQDDSGHGSDLTLYNSPGQTVSTDGSGALALTGGDYAEVPAYESGGAMTVSAWVRFDSTGYFQRVFDFGQANSTGIGNIYVGRFETSSDLTFTMEVDGSYTNRATAVGAITDGQWLHFVATVDDAGAMTLYVNGVEAATFAGTALTSGTRDNYYIGKSAFAGDAAFDGAIDNFVVLNETVSAEQAAALYSQGSFSIDENSANGSVVGTVFGVDSDLGDSLTYSLVDDAEGRFAIDGATGEITVADTALLDYETSTSHSVTIRVTDGSANSYDEIFTVNLTDRQSEPLQTVPAAQSVDEGSTLVFSTATGNAITVSDDSPADAAIRVTLDAADGQMTLAQLTGITLVEGTDSSAHMVLEGLESDINAALDGLVFTPDETFNGVTDITVTTALHADLVADYTFDAGNAANGSATTGWDGTFVGDATTTVDADHGTVLSLDGVGDHVLIDGLFDQPASATLSAWVNLAAVDTGGAQVISLGDSLALSVDTVGFGFGVSGLIYNGSGWNILGSGQYIEGTGWHHIAYSFDDANDTHTLYIDGVAVASATTTDSISYTLGADSYIGTHGNGATDYEFNGMIDDARVYSRVLSVDEIATLASSKDSVSDAISITVNAVDNAPIFGPGDGYTIVSLADQADEIVDLVILDDGSYITLSAVNTASSGQDIDIGLTKYLSDGTIDTAWGTNGTVITAINSYDETPVSMTLQADGRILVVGAYNNGTSDHGLIVRYNADGSLDGGFGSGGVLGVGAALGDNDYGRSILVQPDGKIVVTGNVYSGGLSAIYVTRHNTDGSLDSSFDTDGLVALNIDAYDEFVTSMVLQPDGKIIIGGYNDTGVSMDFALIRLNSDGSYDTSFDGDGIWTNLNGASDQLSYQIALDGEGRILIAGTTNAAGNTDSFVMRVRTDGSLDTTFGTNGSVTLAVGSQAETISGISVQSDGRILIAGSAYNGTDYDLLVVRLNADGSVDTSFGSAGYVIEDLSGGDDQINALAISDTGSIVVGGRSGDDGFLARFESTGPFDLDFHVTSQLDGTPTYVEGGSAVVLDADVAVYDVELSGADSFDGATLEIVRNGGSNSEDIFVESGTLGGLTEGGSLTVDAISIGTVTTNSAGLLLLTFNANATNALVNHAMQQIAYSNSSSAPPASVTLNWTFADGNIGAQGSGGNKTASGSTVVAITAVNSAPVNNTPGPQAISVDEILTFSSLSGNAISISDPDAGGSVVEVTLSATDGSISLSGTAGLSFSLGDGVADASMIFQGTTAAINTALDGLTFTPTANYSGIASIAILTDDLGNSGSGGAQVDSDLIEIDVSVAHFQQGTASYAGTLDTFTDSIQPSTQQGVLHYIGVDDDAPLESGLIRFEDMFGSGAGQVPLGSTINEASLWIYVLSTDPLDQVTVHEMLVSWDETSTHDSLTNGVSTDDVEASATALATIDAGESGWVQISGLETLIQSWAYGNSNYGLAFVSANADGWSFASSEYGTIALRPYIAIDYDVPVAPVLTPSGSVPTFTEGGSAVTLDALLTLTDAENSDVTGVSLQISNYVIGQDVLSFIDQGGITGSWDSGTGTLTLSGTANLATYQTALRSITYSNSAEDPDVTTRSIDVIVSDLYATLGATTLTVDIAAVNDIAYNGGSLPSDLSVIEDVSSSLDLSSLDLADLDDRGGIVTLSLATSTGGQLTLAAASGITIGGNGSGSVTVSGTIVDLNSYLDVASNISYLHATQHINGNNADGLTISVDDNGNTGSGSTSALLGMVNVDITAINDTPVDIAPNGFSINDYTDTAGGYSLGTLTTSDPDSGDSFSYTIVGGADAALFSIGGAGLDELLLDDGVLDFDVQSSYQVILRSTDASGSWIEESLTISVVDQNQAPTDIAPNGFSLDEGIDTTGGIQLGTLSAIDSDAGDSFTFALIGGADVGCFSLGGLNGDSLIFDDGILDFETRSSYTVQVQVADSAGGSYVEFLTLTVNDLNDAPTGLPLITGTATEGQTLTADVSGIGDADGLGTFAYQWLRDGVAISGATGSTYVLGDGDVDAAISVRVSYVDGNGTTESLASAATTAVANVNDAPTGLPLITGTATEGQTLTADVSGIGDADGLGTFAYQWLRDGVAISGATGSTYVLGDGDVDAAISVRVSYVDGNGTTESLASAATTAVANVNDAPTGLPLIAGTATEGQTLTADVSGIGDADGLGTFSYQWLRDGVAISGATGSTYVLGDGDVDAAISVRVSYVDGNGTAESLASAATTAVANVNDAPTGLPLIAGTATEGQTLTADVSGIGDADGLGTFAYQWLRDGVAISGATGSTYVLGDGDVDAAISVRVSYVDGNGTTESLVSAATTAVANVNDAPTGLPLIAGTATEGQTLTADVSGIGDVDGLGTFSYQWLRDGVAISGATGSTYVLGDGDVDAAISVRVSYVDGNGTAESLASAATTAVANVNDAPTGLPLIAGTATEGQTLTADVSGIGDADGLGTFSYQWLRDGVAISGATGAQYQLSYGDSGGTLSVVVSYVDGHGTRESLASAGLDVALFARDTSVVSFTVVNEALDATTASASIASTATDTVVQPLSGEGHGTIQVADAEVAADIVQVSAESQRADREWLAPDGDLLDAALDRTALPVFKEFKRALQSRVHYERIGFGHVETNLVYEAVDQSLRDLKQQDRIIGASPVELSLSIGTALSAGFVTWVIRSGALMSAFMSTMPVWKGFDPMVILGSTSPIAVARARGAKEDDGELTSAERVFERSPDKKSERMIR
ncbi:DUF4347 domain-containing protein [uncultured Cohaesibacter sp.]|uniref:DUF4347 domain-containing protein n=1 Tax=uncultured Cohaesibacter sp. TaxID=1002546 RepID=UPI0029C74A36|nr:DUF4347 domain-containing protein [uncultured Cohaesibacter sp.]